MVCATSKASDHPVHTRSLIRAFASRIVKLLTEHHLEFLSLKGGCRGTSESTLVKMPHCWKSHALAQIKCEFKHFETLIWAERGAGGPDLPWKITSCPICFLEENWYEPPSRSKFHVSDADNCTDTGEMWHARRKETKVS